MKNFSFINTTNYVFGKGQIAQLSQLLDKKDKIMVLFGGGSAKKNGVYDQVVKAMQGFDYIEFWGVPSNPTAEVAREAIALGLKEKVTMLLAVGGGSVLDGTKIIAAGIANPGVDPWDIVVKGTMSQIPFACVMTMPATGSEMNNGAVLSNLKTKEKLGKFRGDYPKFSIMDPEVVRSIPKYQRANAMADMVIHCLEQYLTTPGQCRVLDRWAEGVIQSVMEISQEMLTDNPRYETLCDYAFCSTMALNNYLRMNGVVTQDWATHQIGHALTAFCGITHGESMTLVWSGLVNALRDQKHDKILQMGERIFHIVEGDEEERIDKTIAKMDEFFTSLGLATRLSQKNLGMEAVDFVEKRFKEYDAHYGENANVDAAMAKKILLSRL